MERVGVNHKLNLIGYEGKKLAAYSKTQTEEQDSRCGKKAFHCRDLQSDPCRGIVQYIYEKNKVL
jgi:hypothetical protein